VNEPVTVSVVICAYTMDRWTQLQDAVGSVLRQDPGPLEVVLVVDHCADLEGRARETLAPLGVTVVANRRRRGLSGARNTGCEVARGDVVAFLDDSPRLRRRRVQGIPVLGGTGDAAAALDVSRAEEVVVTIPDAPAERLELVAQACEAASVPQRVVRERAAVVPTATRAIAE